MLLDANRKCLVLRIESTPGIYTSRKEWRFDTVRRQSKFSNIAKLGYYIHFLNGLMSTRVYDCKLTPKVLYL